MEIPRKKIIETRDWVNELKEIKYVHFRDLHKEITHDDYQICTKVDFEPVASRHQNILESWGRLKDHYKEDIVTEHKSKGKSKSQYFTTSDGVVYRLSDHWGIVKSCVWTRGGEGNMTASLMLSGPMEIGRAQLSNFKIHRYIDQNRHLVLNPEWVEQILTIVDFTNYLLSLKKDPEFKDLPREDKEIIGRWSGMFKKELLYVKNLEFSKKDSIFTVLNEV
jgi:hypothetical protein